MGYGNQKNQLRMNANINYVAPTLDYMCFPNEYLLCSSPVPGGNEGLIYEDWGNGGN